LHRAYIVAFALAAIGCCNLALFQHRKVQLDGDMLRDAKGGRPGVNERFHLKRVEFGLARIGQGDFCLNLSHSQILQYPGILRLCPKSILESDSQA